MKYLILIPDGMADTPNPILGNRTPMEVASHPTMDSLAKRSRCGTVLNVPAGMVPESDTANLAILSYDPRTYSKGRSPLEAMSLGLTMEPDDTALRCNFVTLSGTAEDPYESRVMVDHSSDDITTEESRQLVAALNEALPMEGRILHTGVSYRHCLLWKNACDTYSFDRPHDIIGQVIGSHLPKKDNGGEEFLRFMEEGAKILENHPVNVSRRARGLHAANSPWLWSPGKKPALPNFYDKWGVKTCVISAVDLIRGIAICAGCDTVLVDGATGNYHTNYRGKADAAIRAFADHDLVYVHVEAPDECGHQGKPDWKVDCITKIDTDILSPVTEYLRSTGEDFKILVLPDHPTPLAIRTHSSDPVPFFIYESTGDKDGVDTYTEETCRQMNDYISDGSTLLSHFIEVTA